MRIWRPSSIWSTLTASANALCVRKPRTPRGLGNFTGYLQ